MGAIGAETLIPLNSHTFAYAEGDCLRTVSLSCNLVRAGSSDLNQESIFRRKQAT